MPTGTIKSDPQLYEPSTDPMFVEVPLMNFLMLEGAGPPDGDEYRDAVQALFPMAYAVKFCLRKRDLDYEVMPLETLWWTAEEWVPGTQWPTRWEWLAVLRVPDSISEDCYQKCWERTAERAESPAFGKLRLEAWEEGRAVQALHIGPWAEEGPTIEKIHAFITEYGGRPKGRHHEIYLSDPKRTKPSHLRTIVRQPIV